MPAPKKEMLAMLAKMNFMSVGIKLPIDWEDLGKQFLDAFDESERSVPPNPPTNLFREQSLNKYHVKVAKIIGEAFEKYIEGISGAICDGIDKWLKIATITGVTINGPVGMLKPGNVVGPHLAPLIFSTAPKRTEQETKYSNAIANAIGTKWQPWHAGLMGTLTYPAFAAFPGPMAPPTPNTPLPLIAFSSPGESGLSPGTLKSTMEGNLADTHALHSSKFFDAISKAFNTVFLMFKVSTLIQNVLGTGPVPAYSPPFVLAGPVVGGVGNGPPGCLQ